MRYLIPITLLLVTVSLLPACAAQPARTPPGSFLKYRSATVGELVRQVTRDDATRNRYARLFHLTPSEVIDSFSRLKLVTLKHPTRTRSWYVGKSGAIHVKTKLLPKGTPIFATANGDPVLSWSCGNPLRSTLPRKQAKITPARPARSEPTLEGALGGTESPVETKVLAEAPEMIGQPPPAVAAPEVIAAAPVAAAPAPLPIAPPVTVPAPLVAGPAASLPTSTGGLGLPAVAGLTGLVAGLAAVELSIPGKDNPKPPAVPEPSGLAILAAGFAASQFRWRRRS